MYICIIMYDLSTSDLYGKSDNDIVVELGRRFRNYRIALHLTQKDIAEQTGLSVMTIVRFEKGEGFSIRLNNFVGLMRAIEHLEGISESIPDIPESLYDRQTDTKNSNRRVRRKRNEK